MHNMGKIKIAFISIGLATGGAEMMLWKILSRMDRSVFEPVVIALGKRGPVADKIEAIRVPVYCLGMTARTPHRTFWKLLKLLNEIKPDILQGWMYHGNLAALLAAPLTSGRKSVMWSVRHSVYSLKYEKKATAAIIWLCARLSSLPVSIIYNSETSSRSHEALGYRKDRGIVIPNGFDTAVFAPSSTAAADFRRELGLSDDCFLIGLIGRYHPMKDHANFLKAAGRLIKKYPDVHFVLAGDGVDESNAELTRMVEENGLSGAVHLLGRRDDLPYVTAALDIATSASFSESFANVIGEAMSSAVPCVVTDVGDSANIVGTAGIVVPPRDPAALAGGWEKILNMSVAGRQQLRQAARERIMENYSLDCIVKKYEELFRSAAQKGTVCVA